MFVIGNKLTCWAFNTFLLSELLLLAYPKLYNFIHQLLFKAVETIKTLFLAVFKLHKLFFWDVLLNRSI